MSDKPSPRQERHARYRYDMVFLDRVELLLGDNKQEDFPAITIRCECLPEMKDSLGRHFTEKLKVFVKEMQDEAKSLLAEDD